MRFATCSVLCFAAFSGSLQAGVKSLTSDELTETYIKDSTIIVKPAAQVRKKESANAIANLTISPGKATKSEEEEQSEEDEVRDRTNAQLEAAIENAQQRNREFEFATAGLTPPPTAPVFERQINVPGVPDLQIPEGPFNMPLLGDNLGLSSNGEQLMFSIGNLPGIDQVNLPQGAQSDTVNLVPRPGGGFDLMIDIPKN